MKARIAVCFAVVLSFAAFLPSRAAQAPSSLADVLRNMDAAAATFKNAQGNITYTNVTVIVNDKEIERGQFFFERLPKKGGPDLKIRLNFTQKVNESGTPEPSERTVVLKEDEGHIYYPKTKEVQDYSVDKNKRSMLDQFFLLGFGSSSHDLQSAYTVKFSGDAKLNGEDAVRLDLIPKSEAAARSIKTVQLFLSKKTWQPVEQIFTEPNGNYHQAEYDSLKLNATLPKGTFDLNLPGNVKHRKMN
jgi:outer membrane lipoprotein-sorting protein